MDSEKRISAELAREIQRLALAALEGSASDEELGRLDEVVCTDPAAAAYLARAIGTSQHLCDWSSSRRTRGVPAGESALPRPLRSPVLGFLRDAVSRTKQDVGELRFNMALAVVASLLFAGAVAGTGAIISAIVLGRARPAEQGEVASAEDGDRAARPPAGGQESASREPAEEDEDEGPLPLLPSRRRVDNRVARLTRTVDCVWSGGDYIPEAGDDLAAGDKLALKSGLAEIVFQEGAHVILQGPGRLDVRSRATAYLEWGKCAVSVEAARVKGFEIDTRGMKYTDLGTEFGVLVAATGEQEVHVFRGKVRAEQGNDTEKGRGARGTGRGEGEDVKPPPLPDPLRRYPAPSPPLFLTAHEAIRVAAPDASGKPDKPIQRVAANEKQFVRALPPASALDLVDIVAGGNGLSARRNRGINPTNGRYNDEPHGQDNKVALPKRPYVFKADGKYHRVPSSSLIDGVFIVEGGTRAAQLDSAGHSFAGFPRTAADTTYPIMTPSGLSVIWNDAKLGFSKYCKTDYSAPGRGILMLMFNKGITFDLEAIRKAHPRYGVTSFTADVRNPCPGANGKRYLGDFWVFVDGELRFKRQRVAAVTGAVPVNVPLQPTSRFLTLVATDCNGVVWGRWLMFGDPKLVVKAAEQGAVGSTSLGLGTATAHWTIGRGRDSDGRMACCYQGLIDEVRTSDVARSPDEFLFAIQSNF